MKICAVGILGDLLVCEGKDLVYIIQSFWVDVSTIVSKNKGAQQWHYLQRKIC